MTDHDTRKWFIEKIEQMPEYLDKVYLPAVDALEKKAETALHQAIRKEGMERIKYQMGWLDGVREAAAVMNGLRMSETGKTPSPGLLASISPWTYLTSPRSGVKGT